MSNPEKRRTPPPPGTAETAPSKRTSSASRRSPTPTAQAGVAPRAGVLAISSLLNSSHPASSLPNQSQLPAQTGREASLQQERAVQFQPAQRPEPQHDAAAGPALGRFFSQHSLLGFQSIRGADPVSTTSSHGPSHEASIRLDRGVSPSSQAFSLLPNQPVGFQPEGGPVPSSTAFHSLHTQEVGSDPNRGTGLPSSRPTMPRASHSSAFQVVGEGGLQLAIRPKGGADSQSSRPSTPPLQEPLGVLTSLEADPQLSMQFYPRLSAPESIIFNARMYSQSSKATSSLPSQVDEGRKHMDYYRFCLLRDSLAFLHIAKHGKQELEKPHADVTTSSAAVSLSQALARLNFLIKEATERAARLRQQFKLSYSPAIRDLETLTHFYSPEVWRVFEKCKDPRKRLSTLEAKVQTLVREVIKTDAELDLYCEYVLVIDEESRELLAETAFPATHSQPTQIRREHPVRDAAQAHSDETGGTRDADPTIPAASRPKARTPGSRFTFRGGGPGQPSASRIRGGHSTHVGTARDSSSGTGDTQDARSTSPSVTPSMQGGGSRQVSLRGGHAPQPRSSRARTDSPTGISHYLTSGLFDLVRPTSSVATRGPSSGTRGRILAASSSAAKGAPSGTSELNPAASSSAAQGPSSGTRARNPAASSSAAKGAPSETSGLNPAASSSAAQGPSSGTRERILDASSSAAQGPSSGKKRRLPATSSAASADSTPWAVAALNALNGAESSGSPPPARATPDPPR
jgi:hypothetical protein